MRGDAARLAADLERWLRSEADAGLSGEMLFPRAASDPPSAAAERELSRIAESVAACTRCPLSRSRIRTVPGEGAPTSPLLLVGEAPGADEDRAGRPFVGKAGGLLDRMLDAIHVEREEAFIANVLKCRPPRNRTPTPEEIAACRPYLMSQIAAIAPKVILALGRVPTQALLETSRGILSLRGTPREISYPGGAAVLVPTLHPAYLLRSPAAKKDAWADLKLAHRLLREATGSWPTPL